MKCVRQGQHLFAWLTPIGADHRPKPHYMVQAASPHAAITPKQSRWYKLHLLMQPSLQNNPDDIKLRSNAWNTQEEEGRWWTLKSSWAQSTTLHSFQPCQKELLQMNFTLIHQLPCEMCSPGTTSFCLADTNRS